MELLPDFGHHGVGRNLLGPLRGDTSHKTVGIALDLAQLLGGDFLCFLPPGDRLLESLCRKAPPLPWNALASGLGYPRARHRAASGSNNVRAR